MEGTSSSGGLEIGISCFTGPHLGTGGQKHTHTYKSNMTKKSSATVAELTSAISAVSAAASAISELTATTNNKHTAEAGETNDNYAVA
jgi:hypothetical protein